MFAAKKLVNAVNSQKKVFFFFKFLDFGAISFEYRERVDFVPRPA